MKRAAPRPRRPSHATVVAYLALFVALGGTAGALAGKNTVDSRDIKPKAVRTGDLAPRAVIGAKLRGGAVDGAKVRDESITGADLGPGSVASPELAARSVSPITLDLFRSADASGSIPVTGAGSQPLGPTVTLTVPPGGLAVFYAEANIAVNGALGASQCRLQAITGNRDVFLLEIDPGSGNPPQPYQSDLVPAIFPAGTYTFSLAGSVNGVTTNTCTYLNPGLRAFALG